MLRDDESACRKACYRNTVHVHPSNASSSFTIHNGSSVIFCIIASNNDAGTRTSILEEKILLGQGKAADSRNSWLH